MSERGILAVPGFELLRLQTAPEQIADRLLAAIAVGVLYPGEKLPGERELAERLNVSRPTVRLALGRLAALGVIDSRRGRGGGTFVREIRPHTEEARALINTLGPIWSEMEALLDYRSLIHQLIARTAALRHTADDDRALREALEAYAAAEGATDSRRADHHLHDTVAAAARNPHLRRLSQELTAVVNLGFPADPYSEELHERALQQHTALVEAISDGDPDGAAAIAARHFDVTSREPWHTALSAARDED